MAKFKKGDKVVRRDRFRDSIWVSAAGDPAAAFEVECADSYSMRLVGVRDWWDTNKFDLYVEPQPEPVTVTEPPVQQIPGVPDGYRLVRIGRVLKGQQYISSGDGGVHTAQWDLTHSGLAIVEPIVPPAPPTRIPSKVKVQLNRYLVGDLSDPSTLFVIVATEEYMEDRSTTYRLLGPSETLELEVEV